MLWDPRFDFKFQLQFRMWKVLMLTVLIIVESFGVLNMSQYYRKQYLDLVSEIERRIDPNNYMKETK